MSTPKISVIIPIYNVEKYIEKCLNSVRKQTFEDIEIICVDDCSPDNSYKIVEKHIKEDKRIRLIRHEKNLGLGGARNTAIRAAKADYLASVDSDDYMSPTMLETLWNATDNGWFDIVCCGYSSVDENGNILSKEPYTDKQVFNDNNDIDIFTTLPSAFWNKLWRRSLFVDNDIFFPEHDYYEDMSTTPRLVAKSQYIKGIKNNLYFYLARDQSIMNSVSDKHLIDYLKGFEILFRFLREEGLIERYIEEFEYFIQGNTNYYAKYILNSTLSLDKKNQYLRFLILFRITFIENFGKFDHLDVGGLLACLKEEKLQGVYHDWYQDSLTSIAKKEEIITQQWREIDTKAERIKQFDETINKQAATIKNLKNIVIEVKESAKNIWLIVDEKERAVKENKEKNRQLQKYAKDIKEELQRTKKDLVQSNVLLSEKISLIQMFAVLFFAMLTFLVINKEQRLKLINKPILFFRDSKSSFAKQYASWFNIK